MKLAVIGDPIAHSRSPAIQERLLQEAGIDGSYAAIRVPAGEAAAAIRRMRSEGFTGCNVTSPLKEEVLASCDELLPEAKRAGAVNTLCFGSRTIGANTDGAGAVAAMRPLIAAPLEDCSVLVLGTGATARAVLAQLAEEGVCALIWGRNEEKVGELRARYHATPWRSSDEPDIALSTLPPDAVLPLDVVVRLRSVPVVVDANYGERARLEVQLERPVIDGMAMLEAQARVSFDLWVSS